MSEIQDRCSSTAEAPRKGLESALRVLVIAGSVMTAAAVIMLLESLSYCMGHIGDAFNSDYAGPDAWHGEIEGNAIHFVAYAGFINAIALVATGLEVGSKGAASASGLARSGTALGIFGVVVGLAMLVLRF